MTFSLVHVRPERHMMDLGGCEVMKLFLCLRKEGWISVENQIVGRLPPCLALVTEVCPSPVGPVSAAVQDVPLLIGAYTDAF